MALAFVWNLGTVNAEPTTTQLLFAYDDIASIVSTLSLPLCYSVLTRFFCTALFWRRACSLLEIRRNVQQQRNSDARWCL